MKKLLFFVLFGAITGLVQAQVKVAFMNDSVDYKALHRTYAPVIGPGENAVSRDVIFQKLTTYYSNEFTLSQTRKTSGLLRPLCSTYRDFSGPTAMRTCCCINTLLMAKGPQPAPKHYLSRFFRLTSPNTRYRSRRRSSGCRFVLAVRCTFLRPKSEKRHMERVC